MSGLMENSCPKARCALLTFGVFIMMNPNFLIPTALTLIITKAELCSQLSMQTQLTMKIVIIMVMVCEGLPL
jgi:hypothetical protein